MFRRVVRALVALATISVIAVGAAPAQAAPVATPRLVDIDVFERGNFDRIVFRFRNGTPDVQARYVRTARDQDGDRVRLPGRILLVLRFDPARARSLDQGVERPELQNVRAFRLIEDRRGVVRVAVGLRQVARVRIIELPNRLIVDVDNRFAR